MFHRIRPPDRGDYIVFIFIGTGFGSVSAFGYALYLETGSRYAAALTLAAAMGLLLTWVQKRAYDRHVWYAANPIYIDEPQRETITQTQYARQTNTPAGQALTYSNITLPDSDWLKIAGLIIRNGTIRRDDMVGLDLMRLREKVLKGKIIRNGLTGYEDFIVKMTAAGWVEKRKNQTVLTDKGRVHFMGILYPPTLPTTPNTVAVSTATTDDDHNERGE